MNQDYSYYDQNLNKKKPAALRSTAAPEIVGQQADLTEFPAGKLALKTLARFAGHTAVYLRSTAAQETVGQQADLTEFPSGKLALKTLSRFIGFAAAPYYRRPRN